MTTQTLRVDFFVDVPWRTILDLAMKIADRKITTGEDSPGTVVDQLRSLVASVRVEKDGGDAAKKALWAQFTHFVKNGSRDGVFTTGDGRDTGNLVHSLILGYRDWNLEAFKDVSAFVGGQWKFDANVFPGLIERTKAKISELRGVERLQAIRDLQPKIDCLVEFVERQVAKRTRRETGDAAKSAAVGLQAERDGVKMTISEGPVTTGQAADGQRVEIGGPVITTVTPRPAPAGTTEQTLEERIAAIEQITVVGATLEEQEVYLQKRIDKLFADADALRAVDKRDKNATAKESEAFKLEDELKAVRAKIDEREQKAARVVEEAERARAAVEANVLEPEDVHLPVNAARPTSVIEYVRESFGIERTPDDPMAQLRAAASAGDELAKSVLAGYAAGKHPTAERAIQVARDLGVI